MKSFFARALFFATAICTAHLAKAEPTPSLTPLTPAQVAQQMEEVRAYDNGDYRTALSLFAPLAAIGDAQSETVLGKIYYHGWGVPKDISRAFTLQNAAADQGYAKAQDNLGEMYRD